MACGGWVWLDLRYLDYQPIEASQRKMAEDAIKSDHKEKLESDEVAREAAARDEHKRQARIKAMNDAGLEGLYTLYDDMLKADAEWPKVCAALCGSRGRGRK